FVLIPFFLQAEDGIRFFHVTGVQTCALPISNPDSVDAAYLQHLADAGFTRVSFGMQSAVPHVLATLERTHDPARIPLVVRWAREIGSASCREEWNTHAEGSML